MDPLSDVFALLRVKSILSARLEARGSWAMRFPTYKHIKFGGVLEGSFWLQVEGASEPVKLEHGDFYLLTNGLPYRLASDPKLEPMDGMEVFAAHRCPDGIVRYGDSGNRVIGAGGRFTFDDDASDLMLRLLPPLVHIRRDSRNAGPLSAVLDLIEFETESLRPGTSAMAGSLANIVLIQILRTHMASQEPPVGWLGALVDPKIGDALRMMHGDIARRWKIEDVASAVGMSRTTFTERFKALVGLPPLDYLIQWRMSIARSALKEGDKSLSAIAASVGYASDSSFSSAVKRTQGRSPGRYWSDDTANSES
jgi:AraC-like DNA-binding protein